MTKCALMALLVILVTSLPAGAEFELRTWATTAAAPADGGSHSTSASFEMVSRFGGPFVGSAESASFALWGCSVTPVEAYLVATETEPLCVTLRWSSDALGGVLGLNVYRAVHEDGPFHRVNEEVLPAGGSGFYEDRTVWPGCPFWYELRAVLPDESEDVVGQRVMVRTGGTLTTRLYAASPNPFREVTLIQHDISTASRGARLVIYDIAGRVVRSFDAATGSPGRYTVTWDGTSDAGQRVASGVYFCALEANGARQTRRIVYLR